MTQSNFEKNGGTYTQVGDYLIPDLVLPPEEQNIHLGVWGMRYKRYLMQNKKAIFNVMIATVDFFDSKEEFRYTLAVLEEEILPKNIFFKIHRSYVINMLHVDTFGSKEMKMKNGDVLPMTQYKEFKSAYTKFVLDF